MEEKVKLPVAENGYDIAAADAYIEMLQTEYRRVCEWGASLEERVAALESGAADSEETENLRAQNRSLYNNCVAFAKHIKRLEKLRDEQGKFIADELSETENKKRTLEQEIAALEEKRSFLEVSNESAKGQAEAIVKAARDQAEKTVSGANGEAAQIIEEAKRQADELLRERKAKISEAFARLNDILPENE